MNSKNSSTSGSGGRGIFLTAGFRFDLAGTALQIQSISASINPRDQFTSVPLRELLESVPVMVRRELDLLLEQQEPVLRELGQQGPPAFRERLE